MKAAVTQELEHRVQPCEFSPELSVISRDFRSLEDFGSL